MAVTNKEGLTWLEWFWTTGLPVETEVLKQSWRDNECPCDWRAENEGYRDTFVCPVCKSCDISGDFVEVTEVNNTQQSIQDCNCQSCNAEWQDIYVLKEQRINE